MCERQNTLVFIFDQRSPRITAYQIHEWLYEQLRLQEDEIMIQIEGPRRRVYIKFVTNEKMQTVLRSTAGQLEFQHETGEISFVSCINSWNGTKKNPDSKSATGCIRQDTQRHNVKIW